MFGDIKWLYVEQAVTAYIDQPYRQRVYRLAKVSDNLYESKVYELPQPERFVHGWLDPALFSMINADSLITRQGCAVYLMLFLRLGLTERSHLIEYSVLAIFVHLALIERFADKQKGFPLLILRLSNHFQFLQID